MPGKHAAPQSRLLRPRATLPTATTVGAHRSPSSGSRIGRTSSLAAIGLAGTLALTLGGVAVGDEDQPSIGPDDFAVLPATTSSGSRNSAQVPATVTAQCRMPSCEVS